MKLNSTALVLAVLMCGAAVAGIAGRPSAKAADRGNAIVLETAVPRAFGEWTELRDQQTQVVNPQTKELLDKLYNQTLTRTYVGEGGRRIMLSLAYGGDQRGSLEAHKPEVCYPAQGFQLHSNAEDELATPYGQIAVRRLNTSLGARKEPVTYWFTVGDRAIRSKLDQRIVEVRLGLTGQIPDGLLFRVSSIDRDSERGFAIQQKFVADMMASVSPEARRKLSGLRSPT